MLTFADQEMNTYASLHSLCITIMPVCVSQAGYHGVPIACVPHFGDQEMNAAKVINKVPCLGNVLRGSWACAECPHASHQLMVCVQGFGLAVYRHQLTADSVHDALLRLLTDSSFAAAAKRISKQMRSMKRTALQETVGEEPPPTS